MSIEFRQGVGTLLIEDADPPTADFSAEVYRATVQLSTATETVPATLATGEESTLPGARARNFQLGFLERRIAAGLHAALLAAYESTTQELNVILRTEEGAVAVTNPQYEFTIFVTNLNLADADVGKLRQQTLTFPIKAGTWSVATA